MRDEMAEFDARIDGIELPETLDDDNEAVMIQRIRGGGKFTLYWVVGLVVMALLCEHHGRTVLTNIQSPRVSDYPTAKRRPELVVEA